MQDLILHFTSTCLVFYVLSKYFKIKSILLVSFLTLLVGVGKELFDLYIQNESFSKSDILYDCFGICFMINYLK